MNRFLYSLQELVVVSTTCVQQQQQQIHNDSNDSNNDYTDYNEYDKMYTMNNGGCVSYGNVGTCSKIKVPSYDVIDDVAIINTISQQQQQEQDDESIATTSNKNNDYEKDIGQQILLKNNSIQWVVVQTSILQGSN
jgi:hypothetical protein